MSSRRSGGGGAAVHAGIIYQNRVAAWIAARILAERDAPAPPEWDLGNATLEYLRCETEQPVDDLLVGTSDGGHVFIQVKHSLVKNTGPDSAFASVISQFVRQLLSSRSISPVAGERPWERPLDQARDRLLIVAGPESSAAIKERLPALLERMRSLVSGQSLDDAAQIDRERGLFRAIKDHIRREWRAALGTDATDDDIRELLSFVRVQILDVDENAVDASEAINILRTNVVENPEYALFAWNALIEACGSYARAHSGADRSLLQKKLLDGQIGLRAPRSYRGDIERLRKYSRSIVDKLAALSKIRVKPDEEIKVRRRSTDALRSAAENVSLVVVGDPGAGKSGALHDLADSLMQDGRDVVFFAVDRLDARSHIGLRQELGLENEVGDILRNWPGERPGFIITDAFDAARSDASAQTLRDLLSDALTQTARWRVIASIRKFDLGHDTRLQQLFEGRPPTDYRNPIFPNISHLHIPLLDDEELSQINSQSPSLAALVDTASDDLRQLLRTPFNLRLMGELLGAGATVESLTPIKTQIELLDRYWRERVIRDDGLGDAREAVLRRASQAMVERRMLRVNRAEVAHDESTSRVLADILSSNVMAEWQQSQGAQPDRYVLAYAHHLLFDYAAARLMLRGLPETVIALLEQDPELTVAIRPSLVLHFHYEWGLDPDHRSFWDMVFLMTGSDALPKVGKLIGPSVAADLVSDLSDCGVLIGRLEGDLGTPRDIAELSLRHLIGALLVEPDRPKRPLVGQHAPPWCALLERCTRDHILRLSVAYTIRPLLMAVTDRADALTDDERRDAGYAARRLLVFAWSQETPDDWLTRHSLHAVCLTFGSDPVASAQLIRRRLHPSQVAAYGHMEIPDLANHVKRLVHVDPTLVEDLYRAAFTYQEESDATTGMGTGRILSLTSNKKQDYEMGLYLLAESYPDFLKASPLRALSVLLEALNFYVAREHTPAFSEAREESFIFAGLEATIRTDYGAIWDSGGAYDDQGTLKMLDAWDAYVRSIGSDTDRAAELEEMVNLIVSRNKLAVMWRRLLLLGAALPQTLGLKLRQLAWAGPILSSYDTSMAAGELLSSIFNSLKADDRERIERTILSLPNKNDEDYLESTIHLRNRLLGCLPLDSVVTEEARNVLRELEARGGAPPNDPPFQGGMTMGRYTERDYLAEQGVPVEEPQNRRIREMSKPVEEFASQHRNSSPDLNEVDRILPPLLALQASLERADTDGVHPKQRDAAQAHLVEACAAIAKAEALDCTGGAGAFVRQVLLEGSYNPNPALHTKSNASFDDHP